MKSEFYTKERIHHIYAIVDHMDGATYVGKTISENPRSRFCAHRRGECRLTRCEFSFVVSGMEQPVKFHLLESVVCTGSEAYRHVVAWCHFFRERGALMVNQKGTLLDAESLQPQTQEIYEGICAPHSLEEVLTREVVPLRRKPEKDDYSPPPRRLSVSVPEETWETFKSFCSQNALSQKEGLRLLLLTQEEVDCQRLAASIQAELAKKDAEIAELEAKLEKKRGYIRRMRDRNVIVVEACQQFARGVISRLPAPATPKLKGMSFKTAKRRVDFSSYAYPSGSGCDYFTPEHLVYGKGVAAALFVLGRNASGDKVKLRWYDKDSYVGATFKWSAHAYKGAFWLVGYTLAQDGAVDLVAALPLSQEETATLRESAPGAQPLMHPSLDDLIKAAEGKKR